MASIPRLILHIPHASSVIPCKDGFVIDDAILEAEIRKLTDWHTDDLFASDADITVAAPFSRIFCDVERFEDDDQEVMAQFGMGVLYEKTDDGEIMRHITPELRARILDEFYRPHHRALTEVVRKMLVNSQSAVIVDCHSFPDIPFNRSLDTRVPRPDFNIGTDPYHTPKDLLLLAESFFRDLGYSVSIDWPYSGTITPMAFYHKNPCVQSIMLEVNRKLYLRTGSNEKSEQYQQTKGIVQEFLAVVRNWTATQVE